MSRQLELLETIVKKGKISVLELSDLMNVSQVTIRKDLDSLVEKCLIKREHGYAVAMNVDDISYRLASNYSNKINIAKKAASLVNDGETVMIESGSCCVLLAEELALSRKDVSIVTNSAFISNYVREYSNVRITLLGGYYQNESQVCVGPMTKNCAQEFYVDKLFAGTDGFSINRGFSGRDILRTDTVRNMAKSAEKIILLTESLKFTRKGLTKQFDTKEVYAVVTDEGIPGEVKKYLENNSVKVYI